METTCQKLLGDIKRHGPGGLTGPPLETPKALKGEEWEGVLRSPAD